MSERQVYGDRARNSICLELGVGAEIGCQQAWENVVVWGDGNVLKLDCGDGCTAL